MCAATHVEFQDLKNVRSRLLRQNDFLSTEGERGIEAQETGLVVCTAVVKLRFDLGNLARQRPDACSRRESMP